MANETTKQEQLEQWAEMKRSCESRPAEMSVIEWCEQNGITKATYYYRLRELAKAGMGDKKHKSKKKQKKKKITVVEAEPVIEEKSTEVVTEPAVEEEPAEVKIEPAVEGNPTEVVTETETTEANVEEETPVVEVAETAEVVTESAEEPAVEEILEESVPVKEEKPANTLDVTIGPAVIHVNDKTSPELLSKTILSIVSAMQTK